MKKYYKLYGALIKTSFLVEYEGDKVFEYNNGNPSNKDKHFFIRTDPFPRTNPDYAKLDIIDLPIISEPDWLIAGLKEWKAWRKEFYLQEWIRAEDKQDRFNTECILKAYEI